MVEWAVVVTVLLVGAPVCAIFFFLAFCCPLSTRAFYAFGHQTATGGTEQQERTWRWRQEAGEARSSKRKANA